jgi:predicted aspartyl protease
MTVACASKPVEVNTPAVVRLDTTRATTRMRRPAPARNFWSAMANLDPDYPKGHFASSDERQFALALRMMMAGQHDEAEFLLDSLGRNTGDSIIRSASHILLTATLQYQDKWKILAELAPLRIASADSTDHDRAGVELWAAAFKGVSHRTMVFPERAVSVPLTVSLVGTPVVPVLINGKPRFFWLDTGSSMSIISSEVAEDSGVEPLVSDTLEVATATGRVPARPAAIRKLEIGGISIGNTTAMIVASELMEIRVGDIMKPVKTVKIDGIIGFDIISRLNVRIDYPRGTVRLAKPVRSDVSESSRNFFWVGTPIVRLITSNGVPVHVGLDTGAQETYATQRLLDKIGVRTFVGERKQVGGFGGLKEFRGRFIERLRLSLRGRTLLFEKVLVFAPAVSTFADLDGVLGSDLGQTGIVEIDATNGVFGVEESAFDSLRDRRRRDSDTPTPLRRLN